MEMICNWGRYPKTIAKVHESNCINDTIQVVKNETKLIARGNGRCYGDSSLQKSIISTLPLNKILNFDVEKGIIKCESGVLLEEILKVIVPEGYFLSVTPGTKYITIGGAVASNIHGKNHHSEGAISAYIKCFTLINAEGTLLNCSPRENIEIFKNTIGGMGLTGIIIDVTLKLKKIQTSYIKQKVIRVKNLNDLFNLFEEYNNYTYSVAWIDCSLKRGKLVKSILMLGEHCGLKDLNKNKAPLALHSKFKVNLPKYFPSFILSSFTINLFNKIYYMKTKNVQNGIIHYNNYFYPLDTINNWNRIYGKRGFLQYQLVLPFKNGKEGIKEIISTIADYKISSFLAVLKTFGKQDKNCSQLSFPMPGYTLALDFKINKKVLSMLQTIDEIVIDYGGKLYLSKDSRMSKETFSKTYVNNFNHSFKFNSLQSERLGL